MPKAKPTVQKQAERFAGVTKPNTGANNTANIRKRIEKRGTTALTATYKQTQTGKLKAKAVKFGRDSSGKLYKAGKVGTDMRGTQPRGGSNGHSPKNSIRVFSGTKRND